MRVLYVEDNEVNQALVARVMRAKQCEVLFREEGEGALEVLANDADIDLVLLDIELAGTMSGLDVIRTLRARNDRRPVVAITAYAMMGDRERILEAGCDQYLPKPLVIPDLLKLLEDYEHEFAAPVTVQLKPYRDLFPAEEASALAAETETPAADTTATDTPVADATAQAAEPAQPAGTTPAESTPAASDVTKPEGEAAPSEHESPVPASVTAPASAANTVSTPSSGSNGASNGARAANDTPAPSAHTVSDSSESAPTAPAATNPVSGDEEPVEDKRHE